MFYADQDITIICSAVAVSSSTITIISMQLGSTANSKKLSQYYNFSTQKIGNTQKGRTTIIIRSSRMITYDTNLSSHTKSPSTPLTVTKTVDNPRRATPDHTSHRAGLLLHCGADQWSMDHGSIASPLHPRRGQPEPKGFAGGFSGAAGAWAATSEGRRRRPATDCCARACDCGRRRGWTTSEEEGAEDGEGFAEGVCRLWVLGVDAVWWKFDTVLVRGFSIVWRFDGDSLSSVDYFMIVVIIVWWSSYYYCMFIFLLWFSRG